MTGNTVKFVIGWTLVVIVGGTAVLLAAVAFVRTPRPLPANEVMGHWRAEPGASGEGDFYADGTFTLTDPSKNVTTGKQL